MELAQRPENDESENAQVHPRHNEDMVSAGPLKLGARSVLQKRVFAKHHGVHERSLLRRPEFMNFGNDAGVDARPPALDAATSKAGKDFDILGTRRTERRDPVVVQVALVVKRARIAIVARRMDLGAKPQTSAVNDIAT